MIFNSLTFVVFFAIVLALHYAPWFSWHQKKINLLLASYLFYAAWNPPFVILLWVSTVVDWWAAQWMVRAKEERTRKLWMITSVVVNLGMLGYFKYGGFLLNNFIALAAQFGVHYQRPLGHRPASRDQFLLRDSSYTLERLSAPIGRRSTSLTTLVCHLLPAPVAGQSCLDRRSAIRREARRDITPVVLQFCAHHLGLFRRHCSPTASRPVVEV